VNSAEAFDHLHTLVAADADPVLDTAEVAAALSGSRVTDLAGNPPTNTTDDAGTWAASTATLPGTVIVVSGRYWRCIVGGTTAASAPSWPDLAGTTITPARTVTDGGVVWSDNGGAWAPSWDLDRAAMLAWERKAAKATSRYTFTTDGQTFERAQVAAACREQADRYRRRLAGTTRT